MIFGIILNHKTYTTWIRPELPRFKHHRRYCVRLDGEALAVLLQQKRGQLVTVACTINAAGNSVPPLLVFSRVRYNRKFINGAPVGSIGAANKSGWMNENIFITYLEHFVLHSRRSPERKVLLILDNLAALVSLMAVEFCREHGIALLTIPPNTSHKLQPLDVAVYNPF